MIAKPVPLALGFDADDTLWHNEGLFSAAHTKFQTLLASHHDAATVDRALYATELRNLPLYGYGAKGFTLSAIETAIDLTGGRVFFRLDYQPVAMPTEAPENAGFFKTYADFGL